MAFFVSSFKSVFKIIKMKGKESAEKKKPPCKRFPHGGDRGARTFDLTDVNRTL